MIHIKVGTYNENFSDIYSSYIKLLEIIFTVNDLSLLYGKDGYFTTFFFLILYIISIKFILTNMFYSVVYRGY